jgi:hypothetical protein
MVMQAEVPVVAQATNIQPPVARMIATESTPTIVER